VDARRRPEPRLNLDIVFRPDDQPIDAFGQLIADRFVRSCKLDPYIDARFYTIDQFDADWLTWAFADIPIVPPQNYESFSGGQCVRFSF